MSSTLDQPDRRRSKPGRADPIGRIVRRAPLPERIPRQTHPLRVEPLAALEWSNATATPPDTFAHVRTPADARRAWVHDAPEREVLALYLASRAADPETDAPWWLAPLADGRLPDRATAFELEDGVTALLERRSGWVFTLCGPHGCWEYLPSEQWAVHPTALYCTSRHDHWLDVVPAHRDHTDPPAPVAVDGATGLCAAIERIETL